MIYLAARLRMGLCHVQLLHTMAVHGERLPSPHPPQLLENCSIEYLVEAVFREQLQLLYIKRVQH